MAVLTRTRVPQAPEPASWPRHAVLVGGPVLVALVVLGVGWLAQPEAGQAPGAGLRLVLGGGAGAAVAMVLLRWAVWRWLAAMAAALVPVAVIGASITSALMTLLASLALLGLGWRWPARTGRWVAVAAGALAASAMVIAARIDAETSASAPPWVVVAAGVALLPGLAAVLGMGRSVSTPVRWAVGALVLITAAPWSPVGLELWPPAAFAPAAAVAGVMALLRGRRGRASARPQSDHADEVALADFAARYGEVGLAPVTIVIAAYNEAAGLPAVLAELPRQVSGLAVSVLVVDDGSSDGTDRAVLADVTAYLVSPGANRGQGAALRLGYRVAREHGATYIVSTDADGQYDPADLPVLLAPLLDGRADFVTGSRVLGHQETRDRVRRLGVHVFAWTVRLLTGVWVTDTSFGLRAMRAEITGAVTLNQPQYQSSELELGVHSHDYRIVEVPASMRLRSAGASKKGRNLVYGRRYAAVVLGTWWREGLPAPLPQRAAALARPDPDRVRAQRRFISEHRPFLIALGLGATVRVLLMVAWMPAFVYSDGPVYLEFLADGVTGTDRPEGYSMILLAPLLSLSNDVALVMVVQHLLGLVTSVLLYAFIRHWGVGRRVAMLATLPMLFDTMVLVLEHSVLSDTLFVLVLLGAVAVLAWNPEVRARTALLAGILFGVTVTIRLVAEPLVVLAVLFCLVGVGTWRRKVGAAVALVIGFAVPVAAYAAFYQSQHGTYALAEFGERSLYLRTTSFVECSKIEVPDYQRVLCPLDQVGQRRDPTYYLFHAESTVRQLRPPAGVTVNEALGQFARAAIADQTGDYLRIVARDFALNFDVQRVDRYEFDTSRKWRFGAYVDREPTDHTGPAYLAHGGRYLDTRQPLADWFAASSWVSYLPGPVLAACLIVGALAAAGLGGARRAGVRPLCALLCLTAVTLMLVPSVTAEFVWRYQLPALALLPAAAAIGLSAMRSPARSPRPAQTGRTAP